MAQISSDLAPLFGDLSKSEKLSEIKPPLIGMQDTFHFLKEWKLLSNCFEKWDPLFYSGC